MGVGVVMKIIAVNGSHRRGKNTSKMLQTVLAEAEALGAQIELIELADYDLKYCGSCNNCLRESRCVIRDDMDILNQKMLEADGIILGSPVYWLNVTARMKNFMDRTRWMHMRENLLDGKAGAAVSHAGVRNGGQETTVMLLESFLKQQGVLVVDGRGPQEPIYNTGAYGTMFECIEDGQMRYRRSVLEDEIAIRFCKQIGRNMVRLIKRLQEKA